MSLRAARLAVQDFAGRIDERRALEQEHVTARTAGADADVRKPLGAQQLPGEEAWLVGERRASGERKYYLCNLPAEASLKTLAAAIKARWVCEQAHQQLKEELGLDHFEGRSWHGLHHHALLTMIAFAFLQTTRVRQNKA